MYGVRNDTSSRWDSRLQMAIETRHGSDNNDYCVIHFYLYASMTPYQAQLVLRLRLRSRKRRAELLKRAADPIGELL